MKSDKSCHDYLGEIVKDLADENIPAIDFDVLIIRLGEAVTILRKQENINSELELLKSDFQGRIGGMIKAMAAVDHKKASFESALEAIEQLQGLDAKALIKSYRSNSAKFRDCFPTSFGSPIESGSGGFKLKDVMDYK